MAEDVDQHHYVFIGGLPRSGTTLLAAEIARSPGVANLEGIGPVADEGQYVQDVYPTQQQAGGIDRFAYSPDMHLTEELPPGERCIACRAVDGVGAATGTRARRSWWRRHRPIC